MWDINSANARRIHTRIAKLMATDMEPYHLVEREGFKQLVQSFERRCQMPSRKYFTETVIPGMYERIRFGILTMLSEPEVVSFTTDTWTAEHSVQSFMGLTCHWLTNDFTRRSVVLQLRY